MNLFARERDATLAPAVRSEDEAKSSPRGRGQTLEPGQQLGGRYEITGYIGAGGMGAVYSAKHARTGRDLAVKVLLPEFATRSDLMQRFMSEARAAGALNHPGIVEVVDLDHEGNLHYIVMERLEGEELQARIQREHPLDPAFVARVGADIADAIACAHAHSPKIIHRDLKPQNVFLARKGRQQDLVKILDFGIAKLVEAETLEQSLTRSGEIYGTPLYMSPEQLRNTKDVDERADIYAIGVILFHALAGTTPFKGESFPDLVIAISTENHPPLRSLRPDVPSGLAAVIEKAMARNKQDRYAFAGQLRDALLPFAGARAAVSSDVFAPTQAAPTTEKVPPVAEVASRRKLLIGGGVAAAAVIALAVGLGVRQEQEAQPQPAPPPAASAPPVATPPTATAPPAVPPPSQSPAVVAVPDAGAPAVKPAATTKSRTRKSTRGSSDELPPLRPR
jgi:serine/threonine-protein kinase